jgi:hypothetical protein
LKRFPAIGLSSPIVAVSIQNSERTARLLAVLCSPNSRQPRNSAIDEISMADNLPHEQQQQREAHDASYDIIRRFCAPDESSESYRP